jgi:hypothetical protein
MATTAIRLARSQEALWEFVSCFAPDDPGRLGYNVFETAELAGPVDVEAFRAAVADVAHRHEALRLVFTEPGLDPVLRVVDEVEPPLSVLDLRTDPPRRGDLRLSSTLAFEQRRAVDLRSGPLWNVTLALRPGDRATVAVSVFHLVADGWSTGVLLRDLAAAYNARTGRGDPPAPLARSYADAVAPPEPDAARDRACADFWRSTLLPLVDRLPFTARAPHDGLDVSAEMTLTAAMPAEVARGLTRLARRLRVTPFVLGLAAYRILLGTRTGRERAVIGTATSGRDADGAADLVGQFTHNVYIASTVPHTATLAAAVHEVRTATFAAMRHTPSFLEIARAVEPRFEERRPWPFLHLYHSWFQSAAPSKSDGAAPADDGGTDIRERRTQGRRPPPGAPTAAYADWAKKGEPGLTLSHDRRSASMSFNPTIYDRDEVADALHGYRAVLEALLRDPQQRVADLRPG